MKNLVILLGLTLVELVCMDLGGYHRSEIDPQRAQLLKPGVTNVDEAIRILGADPVYTFEFERGNLTTTAVWYSAWGDLMDPDSLLVEYMVEAQFDSYGMLIDLDIKDRRTHPYEHWGTTQALRFDAKLPGPVSADTKRS